MTEHKLTNQVRHTKSKRHVLTVTIPVRLIRAHNDKHVKHVNAKFCAAIVPHLEELSSFLGLNESQKRRS